jgi:hypothetical protein
MSKDLTVLLENHPGTMANLGEVLGKAGINIEGIAGFASQGKGKIHLLVEDAAEARRILKEAGIDVVEETEVFTVEMTDRPGELGKVCRKIADAGVNINQVYLGTKTRLVLSVDDMGKARKAID